MIFHRIDRRDPEAITNRAVGGAAPALDHDVVFAAEIDDVPDDQKIAGETEPGDEREFFLQLAFHFFADRCVTLLRAEPAPSCAKMNSSCVRPAPDIREIRTRYFRAKTEPLRQSRCVLDCFGQIRENCSHFRIALQMALGVLREIFRQIEVRVLANAGENIQHLASVRLRVLHPVCGDKRLTDIATRRSISSRLTRSSPRMKCR